MASNPLECDICCDTYSDDHCPRILPCSHEFCSRCIDELISTQKKVLICPVCRKCFTANSAEDLMINRGLLDAAKLLSSRHGGSRPSSSTPKKSILEFTQDFRENVIDKSITDLQATEAEIKCRIRSYSKMKEGILESNKGIARHMQMMKNILLYNEKTLGIIEENIKLMNTWLDAMLQEKQKFCDVKAQLKAATDFASAGATMDEAGQILHGAEKTVSEIKQLLQENDRRRDDTRKDTLKIAVDLEGATKDLTRIIEELEGDSVVKITVHDFHSFCDCLKKDAQRGIFAVTTCNGTLRVAPVKIESNNQVSFTHLQEDVLPPRCFVMELESLMQWSPSPSSPSLPRAFLDLAYKSTPLGRVIVRVTENGLWGLNFLHMCAGGMGPSYANSQVLNVGNKGEKGEYISMGQYLSHGGGGGGGGGGKSIRAVLSSREDWERESERGETYEETPWQAGEVRGNISYEKASWFWIVTRDHPGRDRYCFGKMEEGLDVLREAILKYPDIAQVKVAQCGLIL
ncbi:uncharacterized protein [Macrobrachium rosenbergii]|uniref:uncharacterized protein n=1 Tax=Macrobrachium rosenbergii TaxID=79674 RepID=UPI0034D4FD49